jgi:hypothetical protein
MIQLPIEVPVAGEAQARKFAGVAASPVHTAHVPAMRLTDSVQTRAGKDGVPSSYLPERLTPYAVRMVVPMRREFDRGLDVTRFLHEDPYAREIIALALTSKDARLRAYATFLEMQMFGARHG